MANGTALCTPFKDKRFVRMSKKELKSLPAKVGQKLGDRRTVQWREQFDIGEIIDLVKKGLNFSEISRVLGCSRQNVVQRFRKVEKEIKAGKRYQEHRADIFAIQQNRILNAISPEDLEKASLRDKVISVGVLFDKEKIETGKAGSKGITIEIINFAGASTTGEGKVGQVIRVEEDKKEDETIDAEINS